MAIRITGGALGGRFIRSPEGRDTRPTSAIARQALFNILQEHIDEANVLDLFAGSGVITAEAISRGAKSSILVEWGKPQVALLKANFKELSIDSQVEIRSLDIRKITADSTPWKLFDLIYADPPFVESYPDLRLFLNWLAPNGIAVFEMPSRKLPDWIDDRFDLRKYGESTLAIWKNISTEVL